MRGAARPRDCALGARPSWRHQLAVVSLALAVGVVAMPNRLYRGDARTIRAATAHLLEHGSLSIPVADRDELPRWMTSRRGQFFYEDEATGRLYSKYRVLNALLVAPPMLVERWYRGAPLASDHTSRSLLFILNGYNVLIGAVIAAYLLGLASRYARRPWVAAGVAAATLFCSYVWYYLRAQSSEIFQIWFFCGFCYHLLSWHDASERGERARRSLVMASVYGILLTQLKPYYGLVIPIAYLARRLAYLRRDWRAHAFADALRLGVGAAIACTWVLVENRISFGSMMRFGYGQWLEHGLLHDRFDVGNLGQAVYGFLLRPDRSVLLHAPLLVLSALAVRRLARQRRFDLALGAASLAAFVAIIGCFSHWAGDWCYGPRYLVFLVGPLAAWSALTVDRWVDAIRARKLGAVAAAVVVAAATAASFVAQVRVNSLEFHANYTARGLYARFHNDAIDRYFDHSFSGVVFGDLRAVAAGGTFPPSEIARRARLAPPALIDALERRLRNHWVLQSNYFWWAPPLRRARKSGR